LSLKNVFPQKTFFFQTFFFSACYKGLKNSTSDLVIKGCGEDLLIWVSVFPVPTAGDRLHCGVRECLYPETQTSTTSQRGRWQWIKRGCWSSMNSFPALSNLSVFITCQDQSRFCEKPSQNHIWDKRVAKNHTKTLDDLVIYLLKIIESDLRLYSNISTA
jgi:hypothetical protein